MKPKRQRQSRRSLFILAAELAVVLSPTGEGSWLHATPINPELVRWAASIQPRWKLQKWQKAQLIS